MKYTMPALNPVEFVAGMILTIFLKIYMESKRIVPGLQAGQTLTELRIIVKDTVMVKWCVLVALRHAIIV